MAEPILKIELDSKMYDPGSIIDKTLVAARDIPVFNGVPDKNFTPQQVGMVKKGDPVGIVYSWVNADPLRNRKTVWWIFWPAGLVSHYYYAPHSADDFDLGALREQGVISVEEKIEEEKQAEEDANKQWYEKLIDKAIPVAITLGLGIAAISVLGKVLVSGLNKKRD